MPYTVDLSAAAAMFPEYIFIGPLTPSEQKAAFHVKDKAGADLCLKLIAPNYERDRLDREILALQSIDNASVVKLVEYTFSSKPGKLATLYCRGVHRRPGFAGYSRGRKAMAGQGCS